MKWWGIALLSIILIAGCTQASSSVTDACGSMTIEQALALAQASDCADEGVLTNDYVCNEITNTMWVDLTIDELSGCSPACVVNVETGEVETNYRCTGLIMPEDVARGMELEDQLIADEVTKDFVIQSIDVTPEEFEFDMGGVPLVIVSGRPNAVYFNRSRGEINVVSAGLGVDNDTINEVLNQLNNSWNYYESQGFTGPELGPDGKFDVHITKGGGYNGVTFSNGTIHIDLGGVSEINKWTIEHEFFHAIQYKNHGNFTKMNPLASAFLDEGLAEYFSSEIAMAMYGLTFDELIGKVHNESMMNPNMSVPGYNNTDMIDRIRLGFISEWSEKAYEEAHMLMRYIESLYGHQKLVHIHNVTKNHAGAESVDEGDSLGINAINQALHEEGINKTFDQIYTDWLIWMFDRYGAIWVKSGLINDSQTVNEAGRLNSYGTHFEQFNISSDKNFKVTFNGEAGKNYQVTILINYKDGSRGVEKKTIPPGGDIYQGSGADVSSIVLIKTQVGGDSTVGYSLNITTVNRTIVPNITDISLTQLHQDSNVFPHQYYVTANLSEIANFFYEWTTDCGEFQGETNSPIIEWWYYSWDCGATMMTLTVTGDGGSDSITFSPWQWPVN